MLSAHYERVDSPALRPPREYRAEAHYLDPVSIGVAGAVTINAMIGLLMGTGARNGYRQRGGRSLSAPFLAATITLAVVFGLVFSAIITGFLWGAGVASTPAFLLGWLAYAVIYAGRILWPMGI